MELVERDARTFELQRLPDVVTAGEELPARVRLRSMRHGVAIA